MTKQKPLCEKGIECGFAHAGESLPICYKEEDLKESIKRCLEKLKWVNDYQRVCRIFKKEFGKGLIE